VPSAEVVSHADAVLRSEVRALDLAPEVVLRLGSPPASKVLGRWLADLAGSGVWQAGIDRWGGLYDPERVLDCVVAAEPGALLAAVARAGTDRAPEGWLTAWAGADATAASALDRVLTDRPTISEPAVARDVVAALPEGSTLVVSSSMPVRDVEWYASPREGLRVLANRGANGIDGVVSTAVGVALVADADRAAGHPSGPTAVLVGDVAFLHDTNALLGLGERGVDLTIVVVDNRGGGIFSFLPQAGALATERFEQLFGTPHEVDVPTLAAAHGLVTVEAKTPADVGSAVAASAATGGARVVLVRTDRSENVTVHDALHAAVVRALEG
jgi:2-succinyl-5-enolpyruvyl-6-hydroxy-3-cyclohexene-1-carboxylate synthase